MVRDHLVNDVRPLFDWQTVLPDFAIFESSWPHCLKKLVTFWAILKNITCMKELRGYNVGKIWATFYTNIWSHCLAITN